MTPEKFEIQIAYHYSKLEYKITLTPKSYDYGVDIICEKEDEKIAIQVKLYEVRVSNYKDVMYLFAGCNYYDCSKAIFITNGKVSEDAKTVANKLGVEILEDWIIDDNFEIIDFPNLKNSESNNYEFGAIWEKYIFPLCDKTINTITGKSNRIDDVNFNYLKRTSSNGKTSKIDYSIFEQCYHHLIEKGTLSRDEINHLYTKRASAMIFAVLAQIPLFSVVVKPKATLKYEKK